MTLTAVLETMKHSPIHNYISPGLDSYLIGSKLGHGAVRMFQNTRPQEFFITPHNHRFDFSCMVIEGTVTNTTYIPTTLTQGHPYQISEYHKTTKTTIPVRVEYFMSKDVIYITNQWYHMTANIYHSIKFSPRAMVLFFEGEHLRDDSFILEPIVKGKVIKTFQVNDWMYK